MVLCSSIILFIQKPSVVLAEADNDLRHLHHMMKTQRIAHLKGGIFSKLVKQNLGKTLFSP